MFCFVYSVELFIELMNELKKVGFFFICLRFFYCYLVNKRNEKGFFFFLNIAELFLHPVKELKSYLFIYFLNR